VRTEERKKYLRKKRGVQDAREKERNGPKNSGTPQKKIGKKGPLAHIFWEPSEGGSRPTLVIIRK